MPRKNWGKKICGRYVQKQISAPSFDRKALKPPPSLAWCGSKWFPFSVFNIWMDFVGAGASLSSLHAGCSHLSPFTYHPWSIIHLILLLMEEVLYQLRLVVSPIIYPNFLHLVNRRIPSAINRYTMVYIGVL